MPTPAGCRDPLGRLRAHWACPSGLHFTPSLVYLGNLSSASLSEAGESQHGPEARPAAVALFSLLCRAGPSPPLPYHPGTGHRAGSPGGSAG